jgi:hypothetical protein
MNIKISTILILLTGLLAALAPARAGAQSTWATRVEAAVAYDGNQVVNYAFLWGLVGYTQVPIIAEPDGGVHALGKSDLWDDLSNPNAIAASGWLHGPGFLILGFDEYLQDGAGTDLTIYHIGLGSTAAETSETTVWVSANGVAWNELGELPRAPLNSMGVVSTSFDFADYGIEGASYVMIEKNGTCAQNEDCFMFIDAVEGHHPGAPKRPLISLASGDPSQAPLEPVFQAAPWAADSDYVHIRSQWQVSTHADFATLVIDWTSETDLTFFTVPGFLLDTETGYYCRVRFYDDTDSPSLWSKSLAIITGSAAAGGEDTTVYAARVTAAQGGYSYTGDFYPVVVDQQGVWPTYAGDGGIHALGEPDYARGGFASGWSHWGGQLELAFDTPVTDLPGPDLVIYHWGPGRRNEDFSDAFFYASEDGANWVELGELTQSGRGVIISDAYNLSNYPGLNTVRYVRVVKNYNGIDIKKCGKYIDAVKGNPPLVFGREVEDNGSLAGGWTQADIDLQRVKFVNPIVDGQVDESAQIAVWVDPSRNADETYLAAISSVDPISITDAAGRPDDLPVGLVRFKVAVPNPGDDAAVTIHLPSPVPADAVWVKYDSTHGWQDFTELGLAEFSDPQTVVLQLTDGGFGDADLTVNGVIVDPGGPGGSLAEISSTINGSDADTDAAAGCFIATAAYGSRKQRPPAAAAGLLLPAGLMIIGLIRRLAPRILQRIAGT